MAKSKSNSTVNPSNVSSNSASNQELNPMATNDQSPVESPIVDQPMTIEDTLKAAGLTDVGIARLLQVCSATDSDGVRLPMPSANSFPKSMADFGAYLRKEKLAALFGVADVSDKQLRQFTDLLNVPVMWQFLPQTLPTILNSLQWQHTMHQLTDANGATIGIELAAKTIAKTVSDIEFLGAIGFPMSAIKSMLESPDHAAQLKTIREWYALRHPAKQGDTPVSVYIFNNGSAKLVSFFGAAGQLPLYYALSNMMVDGAVAFLNSPDAVRSLLADDLNATNSK